MSRERGPVPSGPAAGGRSAVGEGHASHDTREADVETASDAYAARFAGPVGGWLLEVQTARFRELLGSCGRLSVLEVGGGHGQLTAALLADGHRVVSQGSRTSCHARLRAAQAQVAHVTSSLVGLPFADRSFDLVIAIRLLAHVEDWRGLLAELSRVSSGLVLVDFPIRGALHRAAPWLFGAKRRLEGNTRPYFDYTVGEVEAALRADGLEVLGVRRQFSLPMVLHRTLGMPAVSRVLEGIASVVGVTAAVGSPALLLAARASAPKGASASASVGGGGGGPGESGPDPDPESRDLGTAPPQPASRPRQERSR